MERLLRAQALYLSDVFLHGLGDAQAVIRAKFLGVPQSDSERIELLKVSQPRYLECIVERSYDGLGYETQLTPRSKDGGRDVIAKRTQPGSMDSVHIECKRYGRPVGVPLVRQLLGVLSSEKVPRGILVGLSGFTKSARRFAADNPRLELLSGEELVTLLNSHLGSWDKQIDRLVNESELRSVKHLSERASEG